MENWGLGIYLSFGIRHLTLYFKMIKTIDTHAHLDHVENVENALKEAHEAGVSAVVAVGIDLHSNKKNLEIKQKTKQPKIYVAG